MAIKAKSKLMPVWYTPKSEEGEDEPTQFKLKPLNGLEYADVITAMDDDGDGNVSFTDKAIRQSIKYGLLDAKNLLDDDGNPTKLKTVGSKHLPMEILVELAGQIIEISNVSDDEVKN